MKSRFLTYAFIIIFIHGLFVFLWHGFHTSIPYKFYWIIAGNIAGNFIFCKRNDIKTKYIARRIAIFTFVCITAGFTEPVYGPKGRIMDEKSNINQIYSLILSYEKINNNYPDDILTILNKIELNSIHEELNSFDIGEEGIIQCIFNNFTDKYEYEIDIYSTQGYIYRKNHANYILSSAPNKNYKNTIVIVNKNGNINTVEYSKWKSDIEINRFFLCE